MKTQTTRKALYNNYGKSRVIALGYCTIQNIAKYWVPRFYTRGAAGKAWKLKSVHNCGILRRVAIRQDRNEFRAEYCAGQDYTAEIRLIQKIINR